MTQIIASFQSHWAKKSILHQPRKKHREMLNGMKNVNCKFSCPRNQIVVFKYNIFFGRAIPEKGNRAELVLTCLHRNNLQLEEFLGQVTLPLNEMDVYDRPKSKVYKLQGKPNKEKKNKDRGELEVRISFLVKSGGQLGSLSDLSKKEKKGSTLGIGGSLLSLGALEKRKGIKKFAKSLGSKVSPVTFFLFP